MRTWFTADYHLGHENIIKYCNRPFKDVNDMNETIIRNHNEKVKEDDIVFFIGDFCFRNSPGGKKGEGVLHKATHYINQLNGHIVFIKGNHDRNNSLKTIIEKVIIQYGNHNICLVHNPIHASKDHEFNFVGHVHERWSFQKIEVPCSPSYYLINVGVDVNNFRPVSFEDIMKNFSKWRRENEKRTPNSTISKIS